MDLPKSKSNPRTPQEVIEVLKAEYPALRRAHPTAVGPDPKHLPRASTRPRANLRKLKSMVRKLNRELKRQNHAPIDPETASGPNFSRPRSAPPADTPKRATRAATGSRGTKAARQRSAGEASSGPSKASGWRHWWPGGLAGRQAGGLSGRQAGRKPGWWAGRQARWRARWRARSEGRTGAVLRFGKRAATICFILLAPTLFIGIKYAHDAIEAGYAKTAIAVYVKDPDLAGAPIGYIFGPIAGKDEDVYGADRSIPIAPRELEEGGRLYYWYQALTALEDRQHDGGFTDITGIHYRMPYAFARSLKTGRLEGASSLADQTCGALRAELDRYAGQSRATKKMQETLCGIGLAQIRNPREIAALYGTHGYFAPMAWGLELFVRLYWGFDDGIEDSRLDVGRQLVLASLLRYTWTSSDSRFQLIAGRAGYALDLLIAEGKISPKLEAGIRKQIAGCRPMPKSMVQSILGQKERFLTFPGQGYEAALQLARVEMGGYEGEHWGSEVREVTLTIDPNVQGTAYRGSLRTLRGFRDIAARSLAAVVDGRGRFVAWHAGDIAGADQVNRFDAPYSPGSIGKVLLAAAVGRIKALDLEAVDSAGVEKAPDGAGIGDVSNEKTSNSRDGGGLQRNPDLEAFKENLRWSRTEIIDSASKLEVDPGTVRELLECYGTPDPGRRNYLEDAALGMFTASPRDMVRLLYEARYGRPMPDAHIVLKYKKKDGKTVLVEDTFDPGRARNGLFARTSRPDICAVLMHASGRTWPLLSLPLRGTLGVLRGYADAGKTGTVGPANSSEDSTEAVAGHNNMAWALAAHEYNEKNGGGFYTVLTGFGADDRKTLIPSLGQGGRVAGPVARDIFLTLLLRKREGKL